MAEGLTLEPARTALVVIELQRGIVGREVPSSTARRAWRGRRAARACSWCSFRSTSLLPLMNRLIAS